MKRFVELYKYNDGLDAFKGSNGQYQFKPEWHGLFLALFDTLDSNPNFSRDENKQIHTIGTVRDYDKKLIEAVDKYLSEDQKAYIKNHPAYRAVTAEQEMYKKIEDNLQIIFGNVSHMPALQRIKNLVDINEFLGEIADYIVYNNAYYIQKNSMELNKANLDEKIMKYREVLNDLEELLDYELKIRLYDKVREDDRIEKYNEDSLIEALDELKEKDSENYNKVVGSLYLTGELSAGEVEKGSEEEKLVKKQNEAIDKLREDILEEETSK